MNERIKELAEQALKSSMVIDGTYRPEGYANSVSKAFADKFAELIVLECEKIAKDGSWYYDAPSSGWRSPINHVCNTMKQHFGVNK